MFIRHGFVFEKDDFISGDGACPVCFSSNTEVCSAIDRSLNINYLRCNNCFSVFASHYASPEASDRFYKTYYERLGIDAQVAFIDYTRFAKHVVELVSIEKRESISILDYGGGSGLIAWTVASELCKAGLIDTAHIVVVDYSTDDVVNSNDQITIEKVRPDSYIPSDRFAIVIASAVLEHIYDVRPVFDMLFKSIESGGSMYIRTPYTYPLYKLGRKFGINVDMLYPEHVHDFSKKFYDNIIKTFKLDNIDIVVSQPSFFETQFSENFVKALLARLIRFPYMLFKNYPFVGGWEIVARKRH